MCSDWKQLGIKKAGLNVEVLEVAPVLMGRQLDAGSAEILKEIAGKNGVKIRTGVSVAAITGDEHVTGVRLADGEEIPAEVVIVSAGVSANTALAQEMGLEIGRAVKVNQQMETGVQGVYACGDCAEYEGVNYAIWRKRRSRKDCRRKRCRGSSRVRAGGGGPYLPRMNTALFAAGDNGKNPNLLYKTVEFRDMGKGQYRKYFFLNNRLSGVILIGDLSEMAKLTEALQKHALYKDVMN